MVNTIVLTQNLVFVASVAISSEAWLLDDALGFRMGKSCSEHHNHQGAVAVAVAVAGIVRVIAAETLVTRLTPETFPGRLNGSPCCGSSERAFFGYVEMQIPPTWTT